MILALDQPAPELPETYRQWLIGYKPDSVAYCPRNPEVGFAFLLFGLFTLPFLIFAIDSLVKYSQQIPIPREDVITGMLVTVPLAAWAIYRVINRWTLHKKMQNGSLRTGVFCDGKTVVWSEKLSANHILPKGCVQTLKLKARFFASGKRTDSGRYGPDTFILLGTDLNLVIENADSYAVSEVLALFQKWNPAIFIAIDENLDRKRYLS
jgi:hypothetical protein